MTAAAQSTSPVMTAAVYASVRQVRMSPSSPSASARFRLMIASGRADSGSSSSPSRTGRIQPLADQGSGRVLPVSDSAQPWVVLAEADGPATTRACRGLGQRKKARTALGRPPAGSLHRFKEVHQEQSRQRGLAHTRLANDHQAASVQGPERLGQLSDVVGAASEPQPAMCRDVLGHVTDRAVGKPPPHSHRVRIVQPPDTNLSQPLFPDFPREKLRCLRTCCGVESDGGSRSLACPGQKGAEDKDNREHRSSARGRVQAAVPYECITQHQDNGGDGGARYRPGPHSSAEPAPHDPIFAQTGTTRHDRGPLDRLRSATI